MRERLLDRTGASDAATAAAVAYATVLSVNSPPQQQQQPPYFPVPSAPPLPVAAVDPSHPYYGADFAGAAVLPQQQAEPAAPPRPVG